MTEVLHAYPSSSQQSTEEQCPCNSSLQQCGGMKKNNICVLLLHNTAEEEEEQCPCSSSLQQSGGMKKNNIYFLLLHNSVKWGSLDGRERGTEKPDAILIPHVARDISPIAHF